MRSREHLKGSFEKALEALEQKDHEKAVHHVKNLHDELLNVHDRLVFYINHFLSFISEEMGEESVRDAWQYVLERVHKQGLLKLRESSHEEAVQALLKEHMAHGSNLSLEEGEGKTTIVLHCCGSGGRLRKGGGTPAPGPEGRMKEGKPWGFRRRGISYYCSHCSIVSEESPGWGAGRSIRVLYGEQFDKKGQPIDDPCRFEIIEEVP